PVCARSFEMSIPCSPSVPTIMGNSVSAPSMRSTADGSLIGLVPPDRRNRTRRRESPFMAAHLAYRGVVAVAGRDLTTRAPLLSWTGVVAPWLVSRVVSVAVLLVGVNDPARGSRFVQVATRWDGAYYLDIARNGYGPVGVPFPKWPFFPLLPGLIRALSEGADDKTPIFVVNPRPFLVALSSVPP